MRISRIGGAHPPVEMPLLQQLGEAVADERRVAVVDQFELIDRRFGVAE